MRKLAALSLTTVTLAVTATAPPLMAQTTDRPLRAVSDPGVVTTRQAITPAGVQTVFDGKVHAAAFGSGNTLWVLSRTHLYQFDWLENRALAKFAINGIAGIRGLAIDPATGAPVISTVTNKTRNANPNLPEIPGNVRLMRLSGTSFVQLGGDLGTASAGSPALAGDKVVAPMMANNSLAIVDAKSGATKQVPVGIAPTAVVATAKMAYVTNWGGEKAQGTQRSAPTGLDPTADLVRIDALGVAEPGTVSVVDLERGNTVATVAVGRHPTALALDAKAGRLYVANTNDDSISVIDTATRAVVSTIALQPFSTKIDGIAPTAIAIDHARNRLLIACGGINAVAVYDLAARRIAGLIPTGWYPVSVALDASGDRMTVATLLGVGSGQKDGPSKRYVHANRGTAHVIDMPNASQLASYTAAVGENNRVTFVSAAPMKADPTAKPTAVPLRAGEPSLIEHVVFIVKENRTYDQVLGALGRGNGEPSFVMFGEDVTPNTHKLSREFVTLDNLYATGGNSASGHQWVTQANEVSYTLWPGYEGRSYPFDGSDPLAYSARGFIWDAALARGKSVAVFGEYAPRLGWDQMGRVDLLRRWKAGETFSNLWNTKSPIPPLDSALVRSFPAYTMAVPDVVRAQLFIETLKGYTAAGKMPHLTLIQLPSNHTSGTTPGMTTPKAMVADNDLAMGQVVEALTNSPFWPKMAIFVVEDDAQNGVDHVDGHRMPGLIISPYTRRGSVDSTFYAHQSVLKTIELILGLPTLSLFDLIANDMRASFTDTADLTRYTAAIPKQDLFEMNPAATALRGEARKGALASAAMRWDVPDAVPSAVLNRITWHSIKGWDVPYPKPVRAAFSPFQLEDEEAEGDDD
jgi:YVTN family beta-propeller protein